MRCILQRVLAASVDVDEQNVATIGLGLLVYVAIEPQDADSQIAWMADKICDLRIFNDEAGRFARSPCDVGGSVLSVSQFTLLADVRKGTRPSFSAAAPPDHARVMWERFGDRLRDRGVTVATGVFGAHMEVRSVNDGPVTLILDRQ